MLTDLYQLTMAYGYWKQGWHDKEAVFHLFFRKHPFGGNYTVASGLDMVVDYLRHFRFSPSDIQYLGRLEDNAGKPLFGEGFLNYLQRMEFSCDVDAVPEGTVVFPHEPLLRVRGPLIQAQLLETTLLNLINFSSLISTKAARIVQAAQGDSVIEFGLRRAQGPNGAMMASRAAYIGGCHASSNVLAGKEYGIPVRGTHAHSWVMCFDTELQAFEQYAAAMPDNCIFLVDTYDTLQGVRHAIQVGQQLRTKGHEMAGIRLDSGDLAALSQQARVMLDEAGFPNAAIVASDSLDEYRIQQLKDAGARVSVWGVGTRLSTAYDQPALGGVYKLAAIRDKDKEWQYRIKLSEDAIKVSNPGMLNTYRFTDKGQPSLDILVNENDVREGTDVLQTELREYPLKEGRFEKMLIPVFRKGQLTHQPPSIHEIRQRALAQVGLFKDISQYEVSLERRLLELKRQLIR